MSEVSTETVCESCEKPWTERSELEPNYCPSCGEEDPWVEQPCYDWEDVDLPVVFSYEVYRDHAELWNSFCASVFGKMELRESDIANFPDGVPQMEYLIVDLYFKLTEDLELKGPFEERSKARKA